jgi:tetratricopeptide (TPR) repeat protein
MSTSSITAAKKMPTSSARAGFPWLKSFLFVLTIGVLGYNGYTYWRLSQPLTNLRTISGWIASNRAADAEKALKDRLERNPNDDESRIMYARALGARKDLLGCARELHKVPAWSPQKTEALYHEGNTYSILNRAKDAEAAWLEVIKDNPLHPPNPQLFHDAAAELMQLYAFEDRWDDAFVVLWRSFDEALPDDRPTLLSWRIRSELERMAHSESIKKIKLYVEADPKDWEALRALAGAESALGQTDDAKRHYQACLKGRPDDGRAWRDYLTMLYTIGDQELWRAELDRVPIAAEKEGEIWKFRGIVKEKAGDLAGAASDYRTAIEKNPYIVEYHYRLSMIGDRLGKQAEADEQKLKTKQLREARADLRVVFGDFYKAQNEGSKTLPAETAKLATTCRVLGFTRAADEFARLAQASE